MRPELSRAIGYVQSIVKYSRDDMKQIEKIERWSDLTPDLRMRIESALSKTQTGSKLLIAAKSI